MISEPARDRDPTRDLNSKLFSTKAETVPKFEVGLIEQERGLELQITFPEFTFATMLPVVIEIEPASVLKMEFFSERPEAEVKELARDLMNADFSRKLDANVRESLTDLKKDDFSVRAATGLKFPVRL